MAALENAALNGDLFRPHRSPSPARSLSPSQGDTDDELGSDLSRPASPIHAGPQQSSAPTASSSGPQTGPKGVITDRNNQQRATQLSQDVQRTAVIKDQEKHAITGSTSTEEDALRAREKMLQETDEDAWAREKWRASRKAEIIRGTEETDGGRSSGLREVNQEGFLRAVERRGWTVVLIYEPGVPRCHSIMASLLSLSLSLPSNTPLTLLRARAISLGFSLLPREDPDDPDEEPRADHDVLPSLLAYKDGQLAKTWIRVDWEVDDEGIEGLLRRDGILRAPGLGAEDDE